MVSSNYKAPHKVFLVRRACAVVAYNFGSVPPCHPTANIAERPTLTQTKTLQARGPWQQPRHPKFGHWIITKLYISVVLIWDKRINPQGTHDFPATNQIEELQGRCIPTSMGSWRPRLRASKAKNSWKIGPFWCGWFGGFQKWWYRTTIGFPTKNDHFGVFWGYHHLRKHPFIYKHKRLTFDMDQQKSSAKSDVRIKRPPTPAKWDTKKTFSTSALKVLWEHPRKRNNFGKVAWKLWEPQHQAYLSHMFFVRSFKRSLFFVDGERKVALKWNKTKTGTVLSGAIKSFSSQPTLKWKIYNWTEPPQKKVNKNSSIQIDDANR